MVALARAMKDALVAADPANQAEYEKRLTAFEDSLKPVQDKIGELKKRSAGVPVTATEPVFGGISGSTKTTRNAGCSAWQRSLGVMGIGSAL